MGSIGKLCRLQTSFSTSNHAPFFLAIPRILPAAPRILPVNCNNYLIITLEIHKPDVYSFVFVRREFRDDFPNFSITLFFEWTLVFLIRTTGTKHIFLIFYIAVFHIRQASSAGKSSIGNRSGGKSWANSPGVTYSSPRNIVSRKPCHS